MPIVPLLFPQALDELVDGGPILFVDDVEEKPRPLDAAIVVSVLHALHVLLGEDVASDEQGQEEVQVDELHQLHMVGPQLFHFKRLVGGVCPTTWEGQGGARE